MQGDFSNSARRILVIDDNDAIHSDFRKTLDSGPKPSARLAGAKAALFGDESATTSLLPRLPTFELESALQGEEGLRKLQQALREGRAFNVAFVDMRMPPGWDGVQTIQRLWQEDPELQVVICTAYSDYSWEEVSQKLGVSDRLLILKKPFDPIEVSQLAVALSEKWSLKRRAELKLDEMEQLVQHRTAELVHAAMHDKLTALPNRALLHDRISQAIERQKRNPEYQFALLFLDFDRFKLINDSLGHDAGDELLIAISKRLVGALRSTDSVSRSPESTAARLGGDEFVILADDIKDTRGAVLVAERLFAALAEPYELNGHTVSSTASIGITTSELRYERAQDMVRDADTAMYHAKAAGKARYVLFDQKMHEQVIARLNMESSLQGALERNEIFLEYQPIVSLETGSIEGFEALVRWNHPERGIIPPLHFIPCCEETGFIVPLGDWVMQQACKQLHAWRAAFPQLPSLSMSINLSAKQLSSPGVVSRISEIFRQTGVDPASVILEITETVMIHNADAVIPLLEQLRAQGVRLHMDDFGTGYSSLSCLHRFPLTGLKIDKCFVHSVGQRREFTAVVQGIVLMAQKLGMCLVAEGIESNDQLAQLRAIDCKHAQGYLFSRPLGADAAGEYLKKQVAAQPGALFAACDRAA